jgi:hypothetical protein
MSVGWKSQMKRMRVPRRARTRIRKLPLVFPLEPELNLWPRYPRTLWVFLPVHTKRTISRRRAESALGEKKSSPRFTVLSAARALGSSAPDATAPVMAAAASAAAVRMIPSRSISDARQASTATAG